MTLAVTHGILKELGRIERKPHESRPHVIWLMVPDSILWLSSKGLSGEIRYGRPGDWC
jgi:hypothetical protein